MIGKLTAKQEKFCQAMASGMSRREAFIAAYGGKGNAHCIRTGASRAANLPHLKARIDELSRPVQAAVQEKLQMDLETWTARMIDIANNARADGDGLLELKTMETLGRALGFFTEKVKAEISGPGRGPLREEFVLKLVAAKDGRPAEINGADAPLISD